MKRLLALGMALVALMTNFACEAQEGAGGVRWQTNYSEAVQEARATNKPIVLLFTGSDWCYWCGKLEDEILNTREFGEAAGPNFVFIKLDFPTKHQLDARTTQQNKELQQKYQVNSYPRVILIDANGGKIGETGYKDLNGAAYAQHLRDLVGATRPANQ